MVVSAQSKRNFVEPFLVLLVVIFGLVLPVLLVVKSVLIFKKGLVEKERIEETKVEGEKLTPSQILNNYRAYVEVRTLVRGKVEAEPVVCEHQECLFNDPCCGCPSKIDLIISDSQTIFTPRTEGLLRLVDSERQAFCQRVPLSCEYRCGNWVEGAIYDVTGTLSVELAPAGSGVKHPLKYYFQVESEKMIKKVGPMDLLGSLLEEIGSLWRKIKIPRYYLLPR